MKTEHLDKYRKEPTKSIFHTTFENCQYFNYIDSMILKSLKLENLKVVIWDYKSIKSLSENLLHLRNSL